MLVRLSATPRGHRLPHHHTIHIIQVKDQFDGGKVHELIKVDALNAVAIDTGIE